jgi:UDP-N-acetylglucosamine 2-epimerase
MQHYDDAMMSDLLSELDLPAPFQTLGRNNSTPPVRIGQMVAEIAEILSSNRIDAVAVYGDTDSSLAAALAAAKTSIPIIHIEAGCRSGDLRMQEELNRRLIDHMSGLLLAVSEACANHLMFESVTGKIVVTGDPQFDVFALVAPKPIEVSNRKRQVFVTIHRAENVDNPTFLVEFLNALSDFRLQEEFEILWPMHHRFAKRIRQEMTKFEEIDGLHLVDPMPYETAMRELAQSRICITDSGGLQKEAFWLRVPCVTVRPSTEWNETIDLGANRLVGNLKNFSTILRSALLESNEIRWKPDPYGGSGSAARAAQEIEEWMSRSN